MNMVGSSLLHGLDFPVSDLTPKDNLQVQWGSQDRYEIVRKVGRGKYSEVGTHDDILARNAHPEEVRAVATCLSRDETLRDYHNRLLVEF